MELYLKFRKAHLEIIIGKRSFDAHHFFVKKMECNGYCCIYHVEMSELHIGLNNMRTKFGIHSNCGYNCEEVC
jgi:hypothetical protein